MNPLVRPDHTAFAVNDGSRPNSVRGASAHQLIVAARWNEAQLLALTLAGTGQAQAFRLAPDLVLLAVSEGKVEPAQLVLVEHVQEVALVLRGIAGAVQAQHAVLAPDPGVVPRRYAFRSELVCKMKQFLHLHAAVAAHTGARGLAVEVALDEGADDLALELAPAVEGVVRDAQQVGHPPGVVNIFWRAAPAADAPVVGRVPEMERDADDLVAFGDQTRRRHRGVDSSTHGDQRAARHARIMTRRIPETRAWDRPMGAHD